MSVRCTLPVSTDVHIKIMNLYGQMVTGPFDFPSQARGERTFSLRLPNLSAGIYLLKVGTSVSDESCKLTIMQ